MPALSQSFVNGLQKDYLKDLVFNFGPGQNPDAVGFRVIPNDGNKFDEADKIRKVNKVCSNNCEVRCEVDSDCGAVGYCLQAYAHLPPGLWYTFPCNVPKPGNPQSLEIDGYKAVREGNTTYVDAANKNDEPKIIFTNIYLASYSEDANADTQTIYNQIIGHWHFNTNLDDYRVCRDSAGELSAFVPCDNDLVCQPLGGYCDAQKTKITRDTIRLGDLNDLAHLLDTYYKNKGDYPALTSGSYIKGLSTSKWPISWSSTLKNELGNDLPLDPLNIFKLPCKPIADNSNYEQSTCWSETKKDFSLPPYSKIYIYKYKAPADYNLCTELEFIGDGFGLHNMTDQWFGLPDSTVLPNAQFWNGNQLKLGLIQCYP